MISQEENHNNLRENRPHGSHFKINHNIPQRFHDNSTICFYPLVSQPRPDPQRWFLKHTYIFQTIFRLGAEMDVVFVDFPREKSLK